MNGAIQQGGAQPIVQDHPDRLSRLLTELLDMVAVYLPTMDDI
jgi:hypothetical protein